MSALSVVPAVLLLTGGAFFFSAGTVGLLRFPDLYCRLHALTKADNLGLGLTVLGLALLTPDWRERLQLVLIWILVLISAATVCHLLARSSLERGIRPAEGPTASPADPPPESGP